MINSLSAWYASLQEWMMQEMVLPILYAFGGMGYADDAIAGLDWFLFGVFQIIIIGLVFQPLEKLFPVEPVSNHSQVINERRAAQLVDIFYTLIHRLGLVKLILFFSFSELYFYLNPKS